MKKAIFILTIFIYSLNIYSQTNYFNNYYNPINTWSSGINIYPLHNGYICSSVGGDSIDYFKNNIVLTKYDSVGNLLSYKEFKLDSCNYYIGLFGGGGLAQCSNGGYILGGDIEYGNISKHYLMRINENADTLWTKIIKNDTIFSAISQCIETSDKGFILCGQRIITSNTLHVLLIKTDSLGDKLWEKTYNITGFNGDRIDKARNVTETADKGFLLGCYTYDVQSMGMYHGSGDGVVIKIDSMGNVQWTKNMGGPEMDGGVTTRVCQDGNYLIASVYSYFTADYNDHYRGKLRLMKVNPAGYVIWDRQYEPEITSLSAMKVVALANGDIVVGGTKSHYTSEYQGYYDSYLFKVNSNGDSIWYREYAKVTDTLQVSWNNLYNFEPTPDGGFVGCGEVFENTIIPSSIWVFKTDSMGCLQPGCQYVGIEELNKTITTLTVFPNPATTQTTITYPSLKMQGQLQIYNSLGQQVYNTILNKNSNQTILNTQAYKNGLYKIVLREKGEIKGQASLLIRN